MEFKMKKIKVIGVGGCGCNTISSIEKKIPFAECIAIDTDELSLENLKTKIQIGEKITKGSGTSSNPEIGEKAAKESEPLIREVLNDTDILVIIAGMGGGCGSGAAPVIADISKSVGIYTHAIVTYPFSYECSKKMKKADEAIEILKDKVDKLNVFENDIILSRCAQEDNMSDQFKLFNDYAIHIVKGLFA